MQPSAKHRLTYAQAYRQQNTHVQAGDCQQVRRSCGSEVVLKVGGQAVSNAQQHRLPQRSLRLRN